MRTELLKKLKQDRSKMTLNELADAIGMNPRTLNKLITGERQGALRTWEPIISYYGKKNIKSISQ